MEIETRAAANPIYGAGRKQSPLTSPREAVMQGKDVKKLATQLILKGNIQA